MSSHELLAKMEQEAAAACAAWMGAGPDQEAKLEKVWKAKQDALAQVQQQSLAAGELGSVGSLLLVRSSLVRGP